MNRQTLAASNQERNTHWQGGILMSIMERDRIKAKHDLWKLTIFQD
jgi:hypothetical protein